MAQKRRGLSVVVAAATMLIGLLAPPAPAVEPAPCMVITEDTTLTADVVCGVQNGIVIAADNVTLDGNGFSVLGSSAYTGLVVEGRHNIKIKNLTLGNFLSGGTWGTGVSITDSSRVWIRESDLGVSWAIKVVAARSSRVVVKDSELGSSGGFSVVITDSDRVRFRNNHIGGADSGFLLERSTRSRLIANTVDAGPYFPGIQLTATTAATIRGNSLSYSDFRVDAASSGNKITRNFISPERQIIDESIGDGTAGTANTYRRNSCDGGSQPAGLCS